MLLEKLREEEHFTNHEKDVVRYILDHLEQVPSMSAGELARASFTSKATVVRLSQKLGLAGYQEFKLKLVEEVNQGNGVAVMPEEGALYAPADGTISAFFPTGHAIGMTTADGVELLMHVGMDTVQLEGKGFTPLAKAGDTVKKGQKLLEFDIDLITEAGFSLVTPVLVANTAEYADVIPAEKRNISVGEEMIEIRR